MHACILVPESVCCVRSFSQSVLSHTQWSCDALWANQLLNVLGIPSTGQSSAVVDAYKCASVLVQVACCFDYSHRARCIFPGGNQPTVALLRNLVPFGHWPSSYITRLSYTCCGRTNIWGVSGIVRSFLSSLQHTSWMCTTCGTVFLCNNGFVGCAKKENNKSVTKLMWPGRLWRAEVGQLCLHQCLCLTSFELHFLYLCNDSYWWALALESSVYSWGTCWLRWHCQVPKPATSHKVSYSRCGESLQSSAFHFWALCVTLMSLFKQLFDKTCTRAAKASAFFFPLLSFISFVPMQAYKCKSKAGSEFISTCCFPDSLRLKEVSELNMCMYATIDPQ